MIVDLQLLLLPEETTNDTIICNKISESYNILPEDICHYTVIKRSIDARKTPIKYLLSIRVFVNEQPIKSVFIPNYRYVHTVKKEIIIIGAGPAGLFAALQALEYGIKPILFERGRDVKARRRDIATINRNQFVNPESNYCFGEGGAGAYSDGKLYTRSKKRGSVEKILNTLVWHGATNTILVDAHPHIGTNKLPQVITDIRETILNFGGEIHFNSKLTDIFVENKSLKGIEINSKQKMTCNYLILATGHSSRDIFSLLNNRSIEIEFKPFALGVRIEHSQNLIDSIQYKCTDRGNFLPPAAYNLVTQVENRGVFSFCMCPGGIIAPCATDKEEVVTNGWSPSKRNNPYSNSGIVTEVRWEDIPLFHKYGGLAGLYFQKEVEYNCWKSAGGIQKLPAQRMLDFLQKKKSKNLPLTSYHPGIASVEMDAVLPSFIVNALRQGLANFGTKLCGYITNDAVLHAPESRTSSPVRIPRDKETLEHISIRGLYPCGEGAGYAGGIVSAAIDGQNCVSSINRTFLSTT